MVARDIGAERDSLYSWYDNYQADSAGGARRADGGAPPDRRAATQGWRAAGRSRLLQSPSVQRYRLARPAGATNASLAAYQGDTPNLSPKGCSPISNCSHLTNCSHSRLANQLSLANCVHFRLLPFDQLLTFEHAFGALCCPLDRTRYGTLHACPGGRCTKLRGGAERSTTRSGSELAVSFQKQYVEGRRLWQASGHSKASKY